MSLDIILPPAFNDAVGDHARILEDPEAFLARIQQDCASREVVFFDESMTGFIVYKGEQHGELSVYLDVLIYPGGVRANLHLKGQLNGNGHANGSTRAHADDPAEPSNPRNEYSVINKTLGVDDIIHSGTSQNRTYCIIWKFNFPILYPRKKFDDPEIRFLCYLNDSHKSQESLSKPVASPQTSAHELASTPNTTSEVLCDYGYADKHNILRGLAAGDRKQKFEFDDPATARPGAKFRESKPSTPTTSSGDLLQDVSIVAEDKHDALADESADTGNESVLGSHHLTCLATFPITVSLVIKLKSTKPAGRNNILLSTLNIESSDDLQRLYSRCDRLFFSIRNLSVLVKSGVIEDLNPCTSSFPICFLLEDSLNLTYKLTNNDFWEKDNSDAGNSAMAALLAVNATNDLSRPCSIKLTLQVQRRIAENQFKPLSNVIVTTWNPYLDFGIIAPPINSSLRGPPIPSQTQLQLPPPLSSNRLPLMLQLQFAGSSSNGTFNKKVTPRKAALMNVYKQRPSSYYDLNESMPSLTINGRSPSASGTSKVPYNADSSVIVHLTTASSTLSGLKLTFTGKLNINMGEVTTWNLQAINNSPSNLHLSLLVQSPTQGLNGAAAVEYQSSLHSGTSVGNSDSPVMSANQLNSVYNSLKVVKNGVIVLDNDIRFGPLETNSVYEAKIRLVGVRKGIYNLNGIKIFDTNTGDGLDFGKLVEVFVV